MKRKGGFTLVEILVSVAIFLVFAVGVYQGFTAIYAAIASSHQKVLAADLANAQFEIIKNLPYSSVGTVGGNPVGVIPVNQSVVRDRITFNVATTIKNVDDPFDGVAPADTLPADYKLVEVKITCPTCSPFTPVTVTGQVAPKNLENS